MRYSGLIKRHFFTTCTLNTLLFASQYTDTRLWHDHWLRKCGTRRLTEIVATSPIYPKCLFKLSSQMLNLHKIFAFMKGVPHLVD